MKFIYTHKNTTYTLEIIDFVLATMLTIRQSRMTGDTDTGLLPVHVREPAFETAACCTEHLENNRRHTKEFIISENWTKQVDVFAKLIQIHVKIEIKCWNLWLSVDVDFLHLASTSSCSCVQGSFSSID